MTKKCLIVLSVCLVIGAGFAAYVWATGCCPGDNLCNGGVTRVLGQSCRYHFQVYHDRDTGGGTHQVYLYILGGDWEDFTSFLTVVTGLPPYPVCVPYYCDLTLEANTSYQYYFSCNGCVSTDPDTNTYSVNTGDCD